MKKTVFLILSVALVIGCSKDQKAVNTLEGAWAATKMDVTFNFFGTSFTFDVIEEGGSAIFTFTKCKLKSEEWCDLSMNIYEASLDTSFVSDVLYRITEDGSVLETKETDTSSTTQIISIDELTKSDLKVNFVSEELGGPVVAEFQR